MSAQHQDLLDLIDEQNLKEFLRLYGEMSSKLKSFEHLELLFRACRFGALAFVKGILNENSLIHVNSQHSSTRFSPLFIVIRGQQHEIIRYFIEETNADINCQFPNN